MVPPLIVGMLIGSTIGSAINTIVGNNVKDMTESIAPSKELMPRFWVTNFLQGYISEATLRDRLLDAGIKAVEADAVVEVSKRKKDELGAAVAGEAQLKLAKLAESIGGDIDDLTYKPQLSELAELEKTAEQLEKEMIRLGEEQEKIQIEDDIEMEELAISLLQRQIPVPKAEATKTAAEIAPITFAEFSKIYKLLAQQAIEAFAQDEEAATIEDIHATVQAAVAQQSLLTSEQNDYAVTKKFWERARAALPGMMLGE